MVTVADTRATDVTAIMKDFVRDNARMCDSFSVAVDYGTGAPAKPNLLQETLDSISTSVTDKMEDITERGIANGMPIKNVKDLRYRAEAAIQPALKALAKTLDTIEINGGSGTIEVPYEDQSALGTTTIDLQKIETQMTETVNSWMNSVASLEWQDAEGQTFHGKEIVGLPLPVNDTNTRSVDGMWTEVAHPTLLVVREDNGNVPRKMITDTEAAETMAASTAAEVSAKINAIAATQPMPQG